MPTLAAIDVGSHAVRLSVVGLTSVGAVTHKEFQRWPIRLGADAFTHGRIQKERVGKLVEVFESIREHLDRLCVDAYRAVATSAMRDAENGVRIITRLRRKTGVEVEIISGREEGRLSRDALVRALGQVPEDTLLVDLGGGSLELHRARGRWGRSLPMGTVRLLKRFPELLEPLGRKAIKRLAEQIQQDIDQRLSGRSTPLAIGTGGNLNVLARLVPSRPGFYPAINVKRLAVLAARVATVPAAERIERFGLRPDRADMLTPAALVILAVAKHFGIESFVIPGTGLRETILRTLAGVSETETQARGVLSRLGRQLKHKAPVPRLARSLFDCLAPVHGLWGPARAPLMAAACLRDVGSLIDPEDPARHTAYFLEHVAGLGLDGRARRVAAYVAVVAAGADPKRLRRTISKEDRRAADILAGLLRLAMGLTACGVENVAIDLTRAPVVIQAGRSPKGSVELLRDALDVNLRVR